MSTQSIIDKINSDSQAEVDVILRGAQEKSDAILALATQKATQIRQDTEKEVALQVKSIREKKAASDRLESAKILLAQKREALNCVYKMALDELISLGKEDTLRIVSTLIERHAEEGDELYFAENFKYADEVKILPVIAKRGITIAKERLALDGGIRLVGKTADKDLSYGAILSADKERYQAEIAKLLFG
ncbi:MAG: hypothetical protein IJ996_05405 [Clostridia bacterium]|nr:hypothetical protein [Clostridia bacterium]